MPIIYDSGPLPKTVVPELAHLRAVATAAHSLLAALQAYQDGLTSGTGDLEPLYLRWLAAVQALHEALQ